MLKNSKESSIDDEKYKKYSKKAYNYAMKMTERETKQAVEGLYHNLNYQGDLIVILRTQLPKRGKSFGDNPVLNVYC